MQIYDGYIEKKISDQKEFNKTITQIGHLYETSRVEKTKRYKKNKSNQQVILFAQYIIAIENSIH
jgi:hypothetical protein